MVPCSPPPTQRGYDRRIFHLPGIFTPHSRYTTAEKSMVHSKFTFIVLTCLGGLYAQIEPAVGSWQTWVLSSGNQMRLPAPPDAKSTAAELQWLKEFTASADDTAKAQVAYWDAGSPAYRW